MIPKIKKLTISFLIRIGMHETAKRIDYGLYLRIRLANLIKSIGATVDHDVSAKNDFIREYYDTKQ